MELMDQHERRNLPESLTPLNIHAWLMNAGFLCGCSEIGPVVKTLKFMLEWHESPAKSKDYQKLFHGDAGVFYILAGILDDLGLAEHGGSVRFPWPTEKGKALLEALRATSVEEIENAHGEAYDGVHHGYIL